MTVHLFKVALAQWDGLFAELVADFTSRLEHGPYAFLDAFVFSEETIKRVARAEIRAQFKQAVEDAERTLIADKGTATAEDLVTMLDAWVHKRQNGFFWGFPLIHSTYLGAVAVGDARMQAIGGFLNPEEGEYATLRSYLLHPHDTLPSPVIARRRRAPLKEKVARPSKSTAEKVLA
jgi:hypothetical protein